ncbi:hypothetical protein [Actinopolyspora mortivallis]|uniref:hypothetical protein n=1 Tax=Actinopolyspora mortivallis TaxID=33906 RepID=UPI000368A6B9|nr:hypothetical protein [Actinopolyspora mortivallis]
MNSENAPETRSSPAERLAEAALGHPCVVRLDGGEYGTLATYLPGRRVTGVRFPPDGPPEVGVVLRLSRPVPEIVTELRARLEELTGQDSVNITVSDVIAPEESSPPEPSTGRHDDRDG